MSARVDADTQSQAAPALALPPLPPAPPLADSDDRWGGHALPSDHPAWMKDVVSISQRARTLFATLRPVVLHVVSFCEHRVRSIVVGERRVSVDTSGCYRIDLNQR